MSIVPTLADFGNWWLSETREAMPRWLQGFDAKADCRLCVGRGSVRIEAASAEAHEPVDLPASEVDQHIRAWAGGRGRRQVELVIEGGQYLERLLGAFQLPRSRARAIALIDLQSSTPLDPTDSIIVFPRFRGDGNGSRYLVLRRRTLEPLVQAIEGASARLTKIMLETDRGMLEIEPADWRHVSRRSRRAAIVRKIVLAASTACLAAMLATFLHAHWRYAGGLPMSTSIPK